MTKEKKWMKCPHCGLRLKEAKYEEHLEKVHPKAAKTAKKRAAPPPVDKKIAVYALLIALVVVGGGMASIYLKENKIIRRPQAGYAPPFFSLPDSEGDMFVLSEHLGKTPIVLEFFATSCIHCQHFAPRLKTVYERYGDRMLMVSAAIHFSNPDGSYTPVTQKEVKDWMEEHDTNWTHLLTSKEVRDTYRITATPTTFFIGKDGKIKTREAGAMETEMLDARVREIL